MERVFGFREFRPGQESILDAIFSGEDVLVVMPTGGGKSLCYQLPALVLPGLSLVISPLIALMKDQVDSLRVMDLPAVAIHSLMGIGEQEQVLKQIVSGEYKIVYVSPERFRNGAFLSAIRKCSVSLVAVDEAHCISQWGHDFRPDYLRIGRSLDSLGRPQTIALTATATARVREDILEQLKLRAPRQFVTGFDRKNLFFEVVQARTSKEKLRLLADRIERLRGASIVYTGTRKSVDSIVQALDREDIEALGYHAGIEDDERSRIQEAFMEGRRDLIVATNAFGMGIDRSDIRQVIHYQVPGTVEAYYQECGRAGRDGDASSCILLFSPSDRRLQEFFIEMNYPAPETILAVYQALLQRSEDPVWLTYHEIGALCDPSVEEMAVGSSLKILEEADIVHRLQRYENLSELYLRLPVERILKSMARKSSGKEAFLKVLSNHYTDEELREGVQFLPDELIEKAGLSKEAFRRVIDDLQEKDEGTYIPPFRGRGVRLLSRIVPAELPIDFQKLHFRKAYELEKLSQMMAYGTSARCRRAFLLEYFGEYSPSHDCGGCDQCRDRKAKGNAPEEPGDPLLAIKILSGVARLKSRFGLGMAVKMLTGSKEKAIGQFRLDRLSTYGLLSEFNQEQVENWIHELIGHGLLKQEFAELGEKSYRVLLLTPRGQEAMKKMEKIPLSSVPSKRRVEDIQVPGEYPKDLFNRLRELRIDLARSQRLPPYCIFQDRTLRDMAARLPDTPAKMRSIVGVGEVTFAKYGQRFLDVITTFLKGRGEADSTRS